MSDYYAKVVVGVPIDKVFEKVTTETKVTRYNSETGAPYQQKIVETNYYVRGELAFKQTYSLNYHVIEYFRSKKIYLGCFNSLVYEEVTTAYSYSESEIETVDIGNAKKRLQQELAKLGAVATPLLYVILEESY